jgi:hypothetical protein
MVSAVFAALVMLADAGWAIAAEEDEVKALAITPELKARAGDALKECVPGRRGITAGMNRNGFYSLTGDLFRNGGIYSVIEGGPDSLLICRWQRRHWTPVLAFDVGVSWKFPGWNRAEALGREPEATKPFWILELEGFPILVVASRVEKAGQDYLAILLDKDRLRMHDVKTSIQFPPRVQEGYLITEDSSRVKSEWEATYFSRIRDGKFVVEKSWEEWVPYHQPDPSMFDGDVACEIAKNGDRTFTIMDDYGVRENPADFVIFEGNPSSFGWSEIIDLSKKRKPWAKLYFHLERGTNGYFDSEAAYVFAKLTGLPRSLYRLKLEGGPTEPIESASRLKVTGTRGAIRLLSAK